MAEYTKILENGERVPLTEREALREMRKMVRDKCPDLSATAEMDATIDLAMIGLAREAGAKPRDIEKLVIQAATDLVLGMVPYPKPQGPFSNQPVQSSWPKKRKQKKRRNPV